MPVKFDPKIHHRKSMRLPGYDYSQAGAYFVTIVTWLWKMPELSETPIWQRNYYEHILRNERDMQAKWEYILGNPALWDEDEVNPKNSPKMEKTGGSP